MEMEILSDNFKIGTTTYLGIVIISKDFLLFCWNGTRSMTEAAGAVTLGPIGMLFGKAVSSVSGAILNKIFPSAEVLNIDDLSEGIKNNELWKKIDLMHSAIVVDKKHIEKICKFKLTGYKIYTKKGKFKIPLSPFSFSKFDSKLSKYGYLAAV